MISNGSDQQTPDRNSRAEKTLTTKGEELIERLRSSATAFRENSVYTEDGDAIRLGVQADEMDEAAEMIRAQADALQALIGEGEELRAEIKEALTQWLHNATDADNFRAANYWIKRLLPTLPVDVSGDREGAAQVQSNGPEIATGSNQGEELGTTRARIRRFYVASRASLPERGEMWRRERACGVNIISSWIDEDGPGETADFGDLWDRIRAEVASADALVAYIEPDDLPLRGVFVEIGMALAAGIPIIIVAPNVKLEGRSFRPLGSWTQHPLVSFAPDLASAFNPEHGCVSSSEQGRPTTGSTPGRSVLAWAAHLHLTG